MIGIQKQTKWFSLGTFFLVFFFGFFVHTYFDAHTVYAQVSVSSSNLSASTPAKTPPASNSDDMGTVGNAFMTVFKGLLYGVLVFLAFIASVAAAAFLYVLDVSHLQAIMGNPVVWEMWKIVRDFFNLFFIFALLLVAFSTIFQVSKFGGLKSIWSIVLAALFINFSFPVARAIIDVGNVMMYSFLTDMFGMTGAGLTNSILGTAGLADILVPKGFQSSYELKFYLIAIVCMFMFATSFMTLAIMMLLRLVWLPILVMFSPLGFAGSAIPGMSGFSKQWWDKLIKNVFFGPVAVFMMLIAVKFLATWGSSNAMKTGFSQAAISSSTASGTLISGVVYMTIPIIFFWIAITSAESMSSAASGIANQWGSKFLKKMANGVKDGALWAPRKGWQKTKDGSKSSWNNMFAARNAKREELKKYKEEVAKNQLEDRGKPGKNAAREKMDEADKKIIAKGAATGASEKEKSSARIALKRLNDRKRAVNNEDIKKEKQRLEDSGDADDVSVLLAEIKKIDALPPDKLTRDQRMKRAALSSHLVRAQSHMSKEEKRQLIKTDPTVAGALSTNYDDMIGGAPTGLTGAALARYTAEKTRYATLQTEAQMAAGDLLRDSYVGTDKEKDEERMVDQLKVEKFLKEKALMAVREGDSYGTDGTVIT